MERSESLFFYMFFFYQISRRGNQKEGWLSSLDGGKYVLLIHSFNTFLLQSVNELQFCFSFSQNMRMFAFGISHQVWGRFQIAPSSGKRLKLWVLHYTRTCTHAHTHTHTHLPLQLLGKGQIFELIIPIHMLLHNGWMDVQMNEW